MRDMNKEAGEGVLGAVLTAPAEVLRGTSDFVRGAMDAAEKSATAVGAASIGTGVAAAYLAYKLKRMTPTDIDVDRKRFYRDELLTRIAEIRRNQALDAEAGRTEPENKKSLRLA